MCELLLALYKKVTSERLAALKCGVTKGASEILLPCFMQEKRMDNIKIYEINNDYIDYLVPLAKHLFHNKKKSQKNDRKYIGIVLKINGLNYFAPLSSFKPKHIQMKESVDFLKVKNYAVINLNNMFPVPLGECSYVDISKIKDKNYKALLLAEYRYIKSIQNKIRKNASTVYYHKIKNGDSTPLSKRCNDFTSLENACMLYKK